MRARYSFVAYTDKKKTSAAKLPEERTVKKMYVLDDHVCVAFAGIVPQFTPLQVWSL